MFYYSSRNKSFLAGSLLLFLFFLYGHKPVSDFCYYLVDKYTEEAYGYYVRYAGAILAALFALFIAWVLFLSQNKSIKLTVWAVSGILMAVLYNRLVVYSIEYIHFIQYVGLTYLLFYACNRKYPPAIILSLALGLLDEYIQTKGLAPINWRDVLLNAVGTAWGILLVMTMKDFLNYRQKRKYYH